VSYIGTGRNDLRGTDVFPLSVPYRRHLVEWLSSTCRNLVPHKQSPWERVRIDVPPAAFGPGSRWQFPHYFEGASGVPVASIDDIAAWLERCEYATDIEEFHEADVWQEPCAFEQRQRGDCEDFALWAWRKLIEIGVDAEFFVGRICAVEPARDRQHAWVVYRQGAELCIFEPALRDRQRMIQPWSAVKDAYVPHFAVDGRFVTSAFAGCLTGRTAGTSG
jgi:hypothetical protein